MPIVTTGAGAVVEFGSGDVHFGSVRESNGDGVVYLGTGPAGAVGRPSGLRSSEYPIQAVLRFTSRESLDALIEELSLLRAVMSH